MSRRGRRASVVDKFNYDLLAVATNARDVFQKHDADESGTIDGEELEELLYDLGIRLSEENIEQARQKLGLKDDKDECTFAVFEEWWNRGPGVSSSVRQHLLASASEKMREDMIPHIREMFQEADKDSSGAIDKEEFATFYPKLRDYLGYDDFPAMEQIFAEMDDASGGDVAQHGGQVARRGSMIQHDGAQDELIDYQEFEAWLLESEVKRADKAGAEVAKMLKAQHNLTKRFNYAEQTFDAEAVFKKHDADGSGTIDAEELEDMLYELGIQLTEENIDEARAGLGIKTDADEVDFPTFAKWWAAGPAKKKEVKQAMMMQLSKEMRDEYIPHIREMFAEADDDGSGELDPEEFGKFYPDLVAYLGYPLPPCAECIKQIDEGYDHAEHIDNPGGGPKRRASMIEHEGHGDGMISYDEFESWLLSLETKRAHDAAALIGGDDDDDAAVGGGSGGGGGGDAVALDPSNPFAEAEEETNPFANPDAWDALAGAIQWEEEIPPIAKTLALSLADFKVYESLWQQAPTADGRIGGKGALQFFSKSGLSMPDLAMIWKLTDKSKPKGALTEEEFFIALKFIAARQAGRELVALSLSAPTPLPTGFDA